MAYPEYQRRRILIVDDNVDAADSLALLLALSDYQVETAYDGLQAIEIAKRFEPALVILDINMPLMDGFEAARVLRLTHTGEDKPILIALTGMTQPVDRAEAKSSGFDIILPKPVEGDYMLTLVEGVLNETGPS